MDSTSGGAGQVDRTELLDHARSFLQSPEIQLSDFESKRQFLRDKGLSPSEIDMLLAEALLSHPPPIPPRTYPQPSPSVLPDLLAAATRAVTSVAFVAAAGSYAYQV
jgi:hypothetical protein